MSDQTPPPPGPSPGSYSGNTPAPPSELPRVPSAGSLTGARRPPSAGYPPPGALVRSSSHGSIQDGPSASREREPAAGLSRSGSAGAIRPPSAGSGGAGSHRGTRARNPSRDQLEPLQATPAAPSYAPPGDYDATPRERQNSLPRLAPLATGSPPATPSPDAGNVPDSGGSNGRPRSRSRQNGSAAVPPLSLSPAADGAIAPDGQDASVPPPPQPFDANARRRPGQGSVSGSGGGTRRSQISQEAANADTARGPVKWVPHTHANPKHAKFCFICLHGKLEGQNESGIEAEVGRQKADDTDLPAPADLRDMGYLAGGGGSASGPFRRAAADYEKDNLSAVWLRSIQDRVYDASVQNMVAEHNACIISGLDVGLVDDREDDQDREVLDKLFTMSQEETDAVDKKLQKLGAWCISQEDRLVNVMPPERTKEELPKVPPPTQDQLALLDFQPLLDPSSFKGETAAAAKEAMRSADAAITTAGAPGTRVFKGFRVEDLPRPETHPDMPEVEVTPYALGPDDLPEYEPLQPQEPARRPIEALVDPFNRPALHLPNFKESAMPEFEEQAGFGEPRPSLPVPADEEWLSTTRSIFADNNPKDEAWGWGLVPPRSRVMPPLVDEPYLPPSSTGLVDAPGGRKALISRTIWDPELWTQGGYMVPPLRDRGRELYQGAFYEHPDEPLWSSALAPSKARDKKVRDTVPIIPVKSYARFKPKRVSVDLPDFLWELAREDAAGQGIWDVIEQRHDIPRQLLREREEEDRATRERFAADQAAVALTMAEEQKALAEQQNAASGDELGDEGPTSEPTSPMPIVAESTAGMPTMQVEAPEAPDPGPAPAAMTAMLKSEVKASMHHRETTQGATTSASGAARTPSRSAPEVRGELRTPSATMLHPDRTDLTTGTTHSASEVASLNYGSESRHHTLMEAHSSRTGDLVARRGGEGRKVEEILSDDRFMDTLADKLALRMGGGIMPSGGGGLGTHAGIGHGPSAFGAGHNIMRPDPPSFAEPEDEHSQAQLPRALLEGSQTTEQKMPRNMGPTTVNDVNHFTQEKMRGDCYVRLLIHPEANAARKDPQPYEGSSKEPDPTLVTGKERPNLVVPTKQRTSDEDIEEDEDEFADFERNDTVVFSFVRHNRYEAVEALIQQEAGILRARDENLNNLLHVACQNNNRRIAKLLIKNGISVNEKNGKGNTPLHYCSQYHFMQLADYLIAHGADDAIPNNAGLLPCQGLGRTEEDVANAQRNLRADQVGGGQG